MATARQNASAARQKMLDEILAQMRFCPQCGQLLKRFGEGLKACDEHHGVMYVTGKRDGQKVGMFLEVPQE